MLDLNSQILRIGDAVCLATMPDGHESRHFNLTVGATYTILDFEGSNVWTTTDVPGETASYWRGRVVKIPAMRFEPAKRYLSRVKREGWYAGKGFGAHCRQSDRKATPSGNNARATWFENISHLTEGVG